jgi:hypothetical protein
MNQVTNRLVECRTILIADKEPFDVCSSFPGAWPSPTPGDDAPLSTGLLADRLTASAALSIIELDWAADTAFDMVASSRRESGRSRIR